MKAGTDNRNMKVIFLHLLFLAVYSCVFLAVEVPALVDYPNHLARMYLISHYESLAILQKFYYVKTEIAPYLGIDIFFRVFSFIDIYLLGRLFIITSFILISAGVLTVNYALFKKLRYETLLMFPFLLNQSLFMGFINYYFCIGFTLIGFGIWLMLPVNRKVIFLLPYSIFLFFIHIFGFGILMLLISLYIITNKQITLKNILQIAASCIVPVIVMIFLMPVPYIAMAKKTGYRSIMDIAETATSSALFDNLTLAICVLAFVTLLVATRTVRLGNILYMTLLLIVLALPIPFRIDGIVYMNLRLPLFIFLLVAAGSQLARPRLKYIVMAIYIPLAALHLHSAYDFLRVQDEKINEYRAALHVIPQGSKILNIFNKWHVMSFSHINNLQLIEGNHFVPELFTGIPPVKVKEEYYNLSIPMAQPIEQQKLNFMPSQKAYFAFMYKQAGFDEINLYWMDWRKDFDYVTIIFPYPQPIPYELELVENGSFFGIYKVRKPL